MSLPSKEKNTKLLVYLIIPLLLILPILLFSFPIITLGTQDLMTINYFNPDEAILVKFGGEIYSKIVAPVEDNASAPQFFYYVGGIILFPYTFLKGINYQVITIVLRSLDLLSALVSAIFIYFFCIKFFKSILIGIFSSLLFSTTPCYLGTLLACRPHHLEILFIIIAFYFCFSVLEKPDKKTLFLAVFFIGLATATKFGGIFMIPPLLATYLYIIRQVPTNSLYVSLAKKIRLINIISASIMFCAAIVPFIAIKLYLKFQEKFLVYKIHNLYEFTHSRNFRLFIIIISFLFFYALLWFIVNILSNKYSSINLDKNKRIRYFIITNKVFLFIFCVVLVNLTMLFILSPNYFLFPKETIKYFVRIQLAKTTMGTSFNPGLNRPILDLEALSWSKMLFDNFVLNKWFAILFLFYFFYEVFICRKDWRRRRIFIVQRFLFWVYGLSLLSFLVMFVSHKPHHYLIPISTVMGILISFAIFEIPKQFNFKLFRYSIFFIFTLILCLGFYHRAALLVDSFNTKLYYNNQDITFN